MAEAGQVGGVEDRQVTVLDVAASPVLVPEAAPPAPPVPLRELRLALVCYGGVSLAIYMHGITKEFEKLVAASVAYERDQEAHDFADTDAAATYWSLLQRLEAETKVRTKVVVDVVSGTSAGGINGVYLATAIARNRSQEPLRAMWMEKGDIKRLLTGREGLPLALKVPRILLSVLRRRPLLDGTRMSRWLREALQQMGDDQPRIVNGVDSLLGPHERLQLFVPITDFYGYDVHLPADDPAWVLDRTHRHVMQFIHDRRDPALDRLSSRWNDALAFSARATSSFPAAFPPLSIADYERSIPASGFDAVQRRALFASYALNEGASPELTHFIDGGVLDNKPFATTVTAIKLRPAATEVDRRLIYVEPDPSTESGGLPDGTEPGLVQTIIGGYAGIPRKEPIVGDLTDLAVHNANVGKIRDIIETNFDPMRDLVRAHIADDSPEGTDPPTAERVGRWREALSAQAAAGAGFAYPTYLRLRVRAVVDDFAALIAERRGYPSTSSHALFVGRVLRALARVQGLFENSGTGAPRRQELIDTLDLAYHERHIRFLIAALSWWYNPSDDDAGRVPTRDSLDAAKHGLYQRLDRLQDLAGHLTEDEQIRTRADALFDVAVITGALSAPLDAFVHEHGAALAEIQQLVATAVGPGLALLPAALDSDIVGLTADWSDWARSEFLTRHLGFAYWDVITYPVGAVSGVNERDHVEVMRISPHEATILATPAEKSLEGVTLGHFGAFFSRPGRENDYLWGRLDGSERLITLLATPPGSSVGWARDAEDGGGPGDDGRHGVLEADCKRAARLIVASERDQLEQIGDRLDFVADRASGTSPD